MTKRMTRALVDGLLIVVGVITGFLSAGIVLRNQIERRAEELFVRGVNLSDLDGPWPAGLPGAYVALDDRKQASVYFLLAAAELDDANRPRADLYLGLLHKASEPCKAATYLERAEHQEVNLDDFRTVLQQVKNACGE